MLFELVLLYLFNCLPIHNPEFTMFVLCIISYTLSLMVIGFGMVYWAPLGVKYFIIVK